MLLINAAEVRELLPMKDAIETDKKAFLLHSQGDTELPVRTAFSVPGKGTVMMMPAYVKGDINRTGLKIVSMFPGNAAKGIPVVPAQMFMVDSDTGEVCALINGSEVTRIRTGAVSGAATELLSRPDSSVAAIFGTGGQSSAQLEALLCVRPLKEVRVYDIFCDKITQFVEKNAPLAERYGARLRIAASSDEAIEGADIVTTVTTSATPVFDGAKVSPGTHGNGVGAVLPNMRELDERLLNRARVFVDDKKAVLAEAGDILIPAACGSYDIGDIAGEFGDVLAGKIKGRTSDEDITVMETVGFAALDVAAAWRIYENAVSRGIGTNIEF